jgi:hypothetical protein
MPSSPPGLRRALQGTPDCSDEVVAKIGVCGVGGGRFEVDHDIEGPVADGGFRTVGPITLSNPPLHTVAQVRFSGLFRRSDPESSELAPVLEDEHHDEATKLLSPFFVNANEVGAFRDPLLSGKRLAGRRSRLIRARHEWLSRPSLDCETLATLATTTRKNGLAVFRAHPNEESVGALATTVVGLESTLHIDPYLSF